MKNKNKAIRIILSDLKIYYEAIVINGTGIKTDTSMDINTQMYGQLVFDKSGNNTWKGKDNLLNKW